jgi:hypothetical protein
MIIYNQEYEDQAWQMLRKSVSSYNTTTDLVFWFLIGTIFGIVTTSIGYGLIAGIW